MVLSMQCTQAWLFLHGYYFFIFLYLKPIIALRACFCPHFFLSREDTVMIMEDSSHNNIVLQSLFDYFCNTLLSKLYNIIHKIN